MKNKTTTNLLVIGSLVAIFALIIFQSGKFLKLNYGKSSKSHLIDSDMLGFQFYDLSGMLITSDLFFKGHSLVIIHINTDCDVCSSKIKSLLKYIHHIEKADIILASSEDKSTLELFYEANNLNLYPQIHVVQSESGFFYQNFDSSFIPLVLVFNQEGFLVKKIDDLVPLGTIIKYIKIANNEEVE